MQIDFFPHLKIFLNIHGKIKKQAMSMATVQKLKHKSSVFFILISEKVISLLCDITE